MADEVLHTEDNHCQPILVNGELMPTVPEYMPSFPVALKSIKRHFVCKLAGEFGVYYDDHNNYDMSVQLVD